METATAPVPAPRHELCRMTDYDAAIGIITKVWVPHRLVLPERAVSLSFARTLPWEKSCWATCPTARRTASSHPNLQTIYHVNLTFRRTNTLHRGAKGYALIHTPD